MQAGSARLGDRLRALVLVVIVLAVLPGHARPQVPMPTGWDMLLWYDEFDGTRLDPDRWIVQAGAAYPGNMTARGIFVEDGVLHLHGTYAEGRKESSAIRTGMHWGPARGYRQRFTPPLRIEARMQFQLRPSSLHTLWLYGEDWHRNPPGLPAGFEYLMEFDIIEIPSVKPSFQRQPPVRDLSAFNVDPSTAHFTAHAWRRPIGGRQDASNMARTHLPLNLVNTDRWHVLAFEWLTGPTDADKVAVWYVDGAEVHRASVAEHFAGYSQDIARVMWEMPMVLVMSATMAPDAFGAWGAVPERWGSIDLLEAADWPARTLVDYVRIFGRAD